ncbi:MAG TPA: rhomboid family intramembrane serine protease [Thermodesulfobacteriota bacterium]|nr:rhomboid family intramembrane serine protease [Thermodesulfobacteriota bacterium]
MIPIKDDTPTHTFPYVTISIIVINVLVFFYQLTLGSRGLELFIYRTAVIPYEIAHLVDTGPPGILPPPFTLLSAMFVHGGLLHVGGNMLFLWIFGDNIEDTLGHLKFIVFYLFIGLLASLAHILIDPDSTMPMVGASGAVAGVLGAYFMLFPRAQVLTLVFLIFFVTIVRVPAVFFLGFWFLIQVLSSGAGGGIAWFAHIGGFVVGAGAILLLKPKRRRRIFH